MGSREGELRWVSGKEGKAGNRWAVPPTMQSLVGQGPVTDTAESWYFRLEAGLSGVWDESQKPHPF